MVNMLVIAEYHPTDPSSAYRKVVSSTWLSAMVAALLSVVLIAILRSRVSYRRLLTLTLAMHTAWIAVSAIALIVTRLA